MRSVTSPAHLAELITEIFPNFAAELGDEQPETAHEVIQRLAPVITSYLEGASERKVKAFCNLINTMVSAGGVMENAISTCLLEHASQLKIRKVIRQHLSPEAKRELR